MTSSSRRVSALVGFILLIGCMVGIGVVIFGFGHNYSHGPEESFREWPLKDTGGDSLVETKETSMNKMNELAEELERLFSGSLTSSSTSMTPLKNKSQNIFPSVGIPIILTGSKLEKIVPTIKSVIISSEKSVLNPVTEHYHTDKSQMSEISEDSHQQVTTIKTPINSLKLQLRGSMIPTVSLAPMLSLPIPEDVTDVAIDDDNSNNESYEQNLEWQNPELPENEKVYEEDQYTSGADEEDGDPMLELGELLSFATNLYTSGSNSSGMHAFLRVINETLNQGNNSGILAQLNELYSRPEIISTLGSSSSGDIFIGRNSYETSLTAFVFMSFGVFLLNQIHSLINKEESIHKKEDEHQSSRQFNMNFLEKSNLNILFEPQYNNNLTMENENNSSSSSFGRSIKNGDGIFKDSMIIDKNPNYVNNMFRGFLNLVNAYTKNSQALECIWSLYCKELDQTSAKEGLYGLAARINSIGLRLIMNQIPTELTLDVMLRSLLGWDGLPCNKMFSTCDEEKASATLKAAGSSNNNHTI